MEWFSGFLSGAMIGAMATLVAAIMRYDTLRNKWISRCEAAMNLADRHDERASQNGRALSVARSTLETCRGAGESCVVELAGLIQRTHAVIKTLRDEMSLELSEENEAAVNAVMPDPWKSATPSPYAGENDKLPYDDDEEEFCRWCQRPESDCICEEDEEEEDEEEDECEGCGFPESECVCCTICGCDPCECDDGEDDEEEWPVDEDDEDK